MNLDEALGKITDPEVKAFFTKMVSDQNSYITKLENQLKNQAPAPSGAPTDAITQEYIRKKMREDVLEKATHAIIEAVGADIYQAVKPDFDAFLAKNMTLDKTTEEYVIDAFNLVYGRCFAKKDHPVHQVGKTVNPNGTPAPTVTDTNGKQVAQVQNIIAGQPQVMSGSDSSAAQGLPGVQGTQVKNTKDAFARLKERVANNGGNRFQ